MARYDVRRVFLAQEAAAIRTLQADAPEFKRHYPDHRRWLEMALEEVVRGDRLAFGVYVSDFDAAGIPAVRLIGCAILKPRQYAPSIEMKNVYIDQKFRGSGAGTALFLAVEEYCARSGHFTIDIEAPCSENGTVGFLHRTGFRVRDTIRSPYRKDDYLYRMSKTLRRRYQGDPYDSYELTSWLLTQFFRFEHVRPIVPGRALLFDIGMPDHGMTSHSDILRMSGTAVVLDDDYDWQNDERLTRTPGVLLLAFISTPAQAAAAAALSPVKIIDLTRVRKDLRELLSYKPPSFPRDDSAGMLVVVNPSLFDRIRRRSDSSVVYFKTGPVGKYLRRGHRILLFVERTPTHPVGGVMASALVEAISVGSPEEVWQALEDRHPVFTKDEYWRFARAKPSIVGLSLRDLRMIEPLDLQLLGRSVIGGELEPADIGHYYLSRDMIRAFDEVARDVSPEAAYEAVWDVFIAHAGADIGIATDLYARLSASIKVFLDAKSLLLGDDWDSELSSAQRRSLISVVLISPASNAAYYQREEIAAAIQLARDDSSAHRVIPVFIGQEALASSDVPYGLRLKHSLTLDAEGGVELVAKRILEVAAVVHQRRQALDPPPGKNT
jgi:ribosomal protein S18 acetylase RimI-like enzyme